MTETIDDRPTDNAVATIVLESPQQLVGSDIMVSGTIALHGMAQPNAKGTLRLKGDATFSDGSQNCTVQADDVGQIEPVKVQCSTASEGTVLLDPENPSGFPDQKPYKFIQQASPKVTLSLTPDRAPANGHSTIVAKASLKDAGMPVPGFITFDLVGAPGATFEVEADGDKRHQVVAVDDDGYASVKIVDSSAEEGVVKASGSGSTLFGEPSDDQSFTFTTPSAVTLTLSSTPSDVTPYPSSAPVTFEAAAAGGAIYIETRKDSGPLAQQKVKLTFNSEKSPAFFPGTDQETTTEVTTGDDGKASVMINAFTWCSGKVTAQLTTENGTITESIHFDCTIPSGLYISVSSVAYQTTKDEQDHWHDKRADGQPADGGPAILKSTVRVEAKYMLKYEKDGDWKDKEWVGYGDLAFSFKDDGKSIHAHMGPEATEALYDKVTATYNAPPDGKRVPEGITPATIFMKDGYIENVALMIDAHPKVKEILTNSKTIVFGPAWSMVSNIRVDFIGTAEKSAYIYQNGLNQAWIQVMITPTDILNDYLTDGNMPTKEEVRAAIELMDFTSATPYGANEFRFVQVEDIRNDFDKQFVQGQAAAPGRMAIPDEHQQDNAAANVLVQFYITFRDDGRKHKEGEVRGTTVGMVVTPNSPYVGVEKEYFILDEDGDSAYTVDIVAVDSPVYVLDQDVIQEVTRAKYTDFNDKGPQNKDGPDDIGNYQRRWDVTVGLANQKAAPLLGLFISSDNSIIPGETKLRSTEDCVFHDVKRGGYQVKGYLWQNNNYLIRKDDFNNDALNRWVTVTAPDGVQTMTLDGIELTGDKMVIPRNEAAFIKMTIVAGFGDLGKSNNTWNSMAVKVVDVYGNASEDLFINPALPEPGLLLANMTGDNNAAWKPLTTGLVGPGPSALGGKGVAISRLVTTDKDNHDYGNQEKNLYLADAKSDMVNLLHGEPLSAVLSDNKWTFESLGNAKLNNKMLYQMSISFKGETKYVKTFTGENDKGKQAVVGVSDGGDYVQLKPYWDDGTVIIYAVKEDASLTDGTFWQWSGVTDGMQNVNVMVFGYQYSDVLPTSLWKFNVSGQAQMSDPPPPQNQS